MGRRLLASEARADPEEGDGDNLEKLADDCDAVLCLREASIHLGSLVFNPFGHSRVTEGPIIVYSKYKGGRKDYSTIGSQKSVFPLGFKTTAYIYLGLVLDIYRTYNN